jgi:PAS domain-containing protein
MMHALTGVNALLKMFYTTKEIIGNCPKMNRLGKKKLGRDVHHRIIFLQFLISAFRERLPVFFNREPITVNRERLSYRLVVFVVRESEKKESGTKLDVTKSDILGFFYRYPIRAIPVIEKKKIIGILLKDTLTARTSTLSELNVPMKKVISEHLISVDTQKDYHALQNLLQNFKKVETIPALDRQGRLVLNLNKSDLICMWEDLPMMYELEWKKLFDGFSYPVIITNEKGCIEYTNHAFSDIVIVGRGRKIQGKPLIDVIPDIPLMQDVPVIGQRVVIDGENFTCDVMPMSNGGNGTVYLIRSDSSDICQKQTVIFE